MRKNLKLNRARTTKMDEFYTQLVDIEKELKHYARHFEGKTVLCNCDDPRVSNFSRYFLNNFEKLKLKKLVVSCYKNRQAELFNQDKRERAICLEYCGNNTNGKVPDIDKIGFRYMKNDGDFRNEECIALLEQSDIVVTNPPFSLFREYVAQLMKHGKKFLIVGNWSAITYKEVFPLFKENKIWTGINNNRSFSGFAVPIHYSMHGTEARIDQNGNRIVSLNNTCWFTNLSVEKQCEELTLQKKYDENEYSKYIGYDAINVDKAVDIPVDYAGLIGVPITFMKKHDPKRFEIMDLLRNARVRDKRLYPRIIIRHKKLTDSGD